MKSAMLTAVVLAAGLVLTACAPPTEIDQSPSPAASAVQESTTAGPQVVETPEPAVVADEFSQVIGDVLYQGTEIAPVRIGTDTPGTAPAVEAQMAHDATANDLAQTSNKYILYIAEGMSGGWFWKIFGTSRHGSFRELTNSGLDAEARFASLDAALASPFSIDGRNLDRAEYLLYIED